jgi:NTP pyrophosphatase (non-canonical NTP hydrolase)
MEYGPMDLSEYQAKAAATALYPKQFKVVYPMIGMCNEAGEALGKLKKVMRGDKDMDGQRDALLDELGDVLWYIAAVATDLDADLSDIARVNLDKLESRLQRGVLQGDGDKR